MRALMGVLAMGVAMTAAVPALHAQARVTPRTQQDTSVRIIKLHASSAEDIRRLKERAMQMAARVEAYAAQMRETWNDSSMARRLALQGVLERTLHDAVSMQSQWRMACAAARPDEDIPGTIGIEVDSSSGIFWIRQTDAPGKESLTMFFGTRSPRVKAVAAGSPAERAGVQAGDTWISVNGKPLVDSVRFDELLNPGSPVVLRVSRSGRQLELPSVPVARKTAATTADYPADVCDSALHIEVFPVPLVELQMQVMSPPKSVVRPVSPRVMSPDPWDARVFLLGSASVRYGGMTLEALDDAWRETVGVQGDGVGIRDVAPGTPAASVGLRKFDVIRQVNGEIVGSPAAFQRIAVEQRTLVLVVFNKATGTRTVTLSRSER